ncbi:conjugal transfer relaxase TraA 2 [Striga asiatica]|uniref:Conjugal transfer relaxase TraA 2 n=1 Tax=Striga asiatica TaxID=4170 RepID=A0A5A7QRC3_STRAF|nr:conjugal transfer relaxase TraA 2 [Striga asiatica]
MKGLDNVASSQTGFPQALTVARLGLSQENPFSRINARISFPFQFPEKVQVIPLPNYVITVFVPDGAHQKKTTASHGRRWGPRYRLVNSSQCNRRLRLANLSLSSDGRTGRKKSMKADSIEGGTYCAAKGKSPESGLETKSDYESFPLTEPNEAKRSETQRTKRRLSELLLALRTEVTEQTEALATTVARALAALAAFQSF